MNHCEGYIKISHKTVPLIVLSWRQLPEQTIFYKVVLYYSAFMLATGRINSIMSKWIFNYEEVIWIAVQWLFFSTSELESRDLGSILPKLANSIMRNAESILGDYCYLFFCWLTFGFFHPSSFSGKWRKKTVQREAKFSHKWYLQCVPAAGSSQCFFHHLSMYQA